MSIGAQRTMRAAVVASALVILPGIGRAADLSTAQPALAPVTPTEWSFRVTPYGWLPSMSGTQTVRGRTAKVDASFIDVLEKSDTLVGLMGDFEARYGRWSLIGDAVWMKVGLDQGTTRTRSTASGVTGNVGASLGLDVRMAIVELGGTYELARSGALSLDALAGGRYWHQKADLSLDLATTVSIGDLEVGGARAIARSGSVAWTDPFIGARLRYAVAPGHELSLRGDVGGFGVGSRFSWQAIAAYGFDIGTHAGVTWSGVVGYRALAVDYAKGAGNTRYEFDMVMHGPVVGVSARF
jgi:hypothetical protein